MGKRYGNISKDFLAFIAVSIVCSGPPSDISLDCFGIQVRVSSPPIPQAPKMERVPPYKVVLYTWTFSGSWAEELWQSTHQ